LQIEWAGNDGIQSIVATARASFGKPFFMEVVVTACRHIWLLEMEISLEMRDPLLQSGNVIYS
jgi:hypothetical protein